MLSETTLLYPNDFKRNSSSKELVTKYSSETKEDLEKENAVFSIAGRVLTIRKMGNSTFANLHDETGKIQLFISKSNIGKDIYKLLDYTIKIKTVFRNNKNGYN